MEVVRDCFLEESGAGAGCSISPAVDNEEAALLHEEATMTIEELLTRYVGRTVTRVLPTANLELGQARNQGPRASMGRQDPRTHLGKLLQRKMAPQPRLTQAFPPTRNVGLRQAKVGSLALPLVRLGLPALQPAKLPRVAKSKFFEDRRMSQMRRRRKRKTAR